jgi:hypothetical protein
LITTSENHPATNARFAWSLRPVILLPAAYIIITIAHESTHALTAYALGVGFRFFHFAVELSPDSTVVQRAIIGVAGPLCALVIGVVCWFFYTRARGSRSELLLLYFTLFGVGTFFGNLTSTAFVGDFSRAAVTLDLSMPARFAVSLAGLLLICALNFFAGWELRRLSPAGSSKLHAAIVMVVVPAIAGTAIAVLSSLPMPSALLFGRILESVFWLFGFAGVLISRNTPAGSERTLHVSWGDMAVLAAAIIVVRIIALSVAFQ